MDKTKRPYMMSEEALAQRRGAQPAAVRAGTLAGKSTGPASEDGKAASSRNAWKHGRFSALNRAQFGLGAASVSKLFGKPCVTTCPFHPDNPDRTEAPCSLVLDGLTHAGGSCLDKTVYVHALQSLMDAMQNGEMEGMHGVLATEMAANLQVLNAIRNAINEEGVYIAVYERYKEGGVVCHPKTGEPMVFDMKLNPALAALAKFTEVFGMNFGDMLATPKARQQIADEDDAAGAVQNMIGRIFGRAAKRPALPGRTLEQDE